MGRGKPLTVRMFVGDRPIEELTPEERSEFARKMIERMGNTANQYYSAHPDEIEPMLRSIGAL